MDIRPFNEKDVYPTEIQNVPENLKAWQADVSGPSGIVNGVCDLLDGKAKIVVFASLNHSNGQWWVTSVNSIGLSKDEKSVRWCGDGDDPEGGGSSVVVASWYGPNALSLSIVSATIAAHMGSSVVRLKA